MCFVWSRPYQDTCFFLLNHLCFLFIDRDSDGGTAANSYDRREGRGKGRGRPPGLTGKEIGRSISKSRVEVVHSEKMFVPIFEQHGILRRSSTVGMFASHCEVFNCYVVGIMLDCTHTCKVSHVLIDS
jgi:hypothetical protein